MAFAMDRHNTDAQSATETNPGGTFTLGGVDSSLYTGEIDFVPVSDQSFWTLPIVSLTVNGQAVELQDASCAVDTGTTLIGGPLEFVQAIYDQLGGGPGRDQLEGLWIYPCSVGDVTVATNFGGKTWEMSPEDFLFQQVSSSECIGAFIDVDLGGVGPSWIYGAAFLKNVYAVYRWDDTAAVGFAARGSGGSTTSTSTGSKSGGSGGNSSSAGGGAATLGVPAASLALALAASVFFA